jgi:hypothetical protein
MLVIATSNDARYIAGHLFCSPARMLEQRRKAYPMLCTHLVMQKKHDGAQSLPMPDAGG